MSLARAYREDYFNKNLVVLKVRILQKLAVKIGVLRNYFQLLIKICLAGCSLDVAVFDFYVFFSRE